MKEKAYAKINLCLDVVGKRDDGYHELRMIMVPVDFYDTLEMQFAEETELRLNRSYLPVNEKNTVIKAIRIMQEKYQLDTGFSCTLFKHIPTRAGLAGGSADAAAAIRMIDRMCGLHMSDEEKIKIAKQVGADVPFCLFNRPAYVEGIGEKLTPFPCNVDPEILLVKPRMGVSTKEAFEIVDQHNEVHPDCLAMRKAMIEGDYEGMIANLGNSLEAASLLLVEDIRLIKESLKAKGFDGVLMSGSGSTVFCITKDRKLAEQAMAEMRKKGYFVRKTRILR
jgi:4-diphosphocytidyl-2-C-methyl-D-erythritol kinase